MAQPNQFTKAAEAGQEKPAGANQFTTGKRTTHDESTRDKLRSEFAAKVLERIARSRKASTSDRCAAAKALLPYGKPILSSTEMATINEWDKLSEQEVLDMAKALILQHPEVIQALNLVPAPSVVATETDTSLATGTEGPLQP